MEVLKPSIIQVGSRCYRRNTTDLPPGWRHDEEGEQIVDSFQDQEMYSCLDEELEESSCDLNFQETEKGFSLTLDVPGPFFGYIIGRGGETKKRIELETQSQISIPQQNNISKGHQHNSNKLDQIVLRGAQKKGLISAKTRIDVLVDTARQKHPFTHFLSFPLNTTLLKESFLDFKEDVLRDCDGTLGLDEQIFQDPNKLHLTIATLVLLTQKEIQTAQDLLDQCKVEIIEPLLQGTSCKVNMKGLEYMNDDPNMVRILYAKIIPVDNSSKLQLIADSLMEKFRYAGLAIKDFERVKIHATLMNCTFKRGGDTFVARDNSSSLSDFFNATPILERFGDRMFGCHHVDSVHISQRGSYDEDGFYLSVGKIELP